MPLRQRLRSLDWDAIAGIVAAVAALVLHLLHVVESEVILAVILVLLALILLRDLRREDREDREAVTLASMDAAIEQVRAALRPPDSLLIGPRSLRAESARFAGRARGEMVWFNVCLLMFVPQTLFDVLLRPAIENPRVTAIRFILDERERERWTADVLPKVARCPGAEKVLEPIWRHLDESISFILAETEPAGAVEAHVSFWGEPFMARTAGRDVPRYIFHVQAHSELIPRLEELARSYRLGV
ncbi:MAG TPA: hypothetical protein VIO14_12615 [Dehalococcoidia bacterium]